MKTAAWRVSSTLLNTSVYDCHNFSNSSQYCLSCYNYLFCSSVLVRTIRYTVTTPTIEYVSLVSRSLSSYELERTTETAAASDGVGAKIYSSIA